MGPRHAAWLVMMPCTPRLFDGSAMQVCVQTHAQSLPAVSCWGACLQAEGVAGSAASQQAGCRVGRRHGEAGQWRKASASANGAVASALKLLAEV